MPSDVPIDYGQLTHLRQVLAPRLAVLPSPQIRAQLDSTFGEGAADAYEAQLESIFSNITRALSSASREVGRAASAAAPTIGAIASGAAQGAMAGSALGPFGALGGALVGGTAQGLSRTGNRTLRDIGSGLSTVTNMAGQFTPMGRLGAAVVPAISGLAGAAASGRPQAALGALPGLIGALGGGAGGAAGGAGTLASLLGGTRGVSGMMGNAGRLTGAAGAATQLFGGNTALDQISSFLQRLDTNRAFAALGLRQFGAPSIAVGSAQRMVPTSAFPRLLAQLADQAVLEAVGHAAETEGDLSYMQDANGEYIGDPALPRDRAALLWELLNEAQLERVVGLALEAAGEDESVEHEESGAEHDFEQEEQEEYDALDSAELYAMEAVPGHWLDYPDWASDHRHV